ncbi:MAG: TlpA disulfide reductase family protein [Gammaproteobacteria bacterium]|nr:TlpA disulfide reductase family protein [Gammaproteobacteria bacterium]
MAKLGTLDSKTTTPRRSGWAALMLGAIAFATTASAVEQGDQAPAFRGVDFNGASVEFPALLDGKPTVVVFWATWCEYCKAFMPYLANIQNDYGTDKINVLTINAKEDGSGDPAAYIDALQMDVIAVADGDAIAAAYGVEFIPGLMVVAPDGTVAYRRAWTELPAGERVATFWSRQVRRALDQLL